MREKFALIFIIIFLFISCTGCQLAQPEKGIAGDKLVGAYITTEAVTVYEDSYLSLNPMWFGSPEPENDGKIYGTFDEENNTLTFPNITGYPLFQLTVEMDGVPSHSIISDASDLHQLISRSDTEADKIEISGTFYYDTNKVATHFYCDEPDEEYEQMEDIIVTTEEYGDGEMEYHYQTPGQDINFYVNSLYQTPSGEYYIIADTGTFCCGGDSSQTLSSEATVDSKELSSFQVTANFKEMVSTDTVTFTQIDKNGKALKEDTYTADNFPETYTYPDNADYILITRTDMNGIVRYETINRDDDFYSCFFSTDTVFCEELQLEVIH